MKTVQLSLPDLLADQLASAGLLEPEKAEAIFRERLRAEAGQRWDAVRRAQEADPEPPMSAEEIQAEIDAYRAEKRLASGS